MKNLDDDTLNTEAFFRSQDIVGKRMVNIVGFSAVMLFVLGLCGMYFVVDKFQHALYLEGIVTLLLSLISIIVALVLLAVAGTVIDWGGKAQRAIESAKG